MNRLQQRKLTRQEPDSNPNAHLLCNERTGSLLAYHAIQARIRERDIRERDIRERDIRERDIRERDIGESDIRERDIGERDIGETVATCRFTSTSEVFPAASASRKVGNAGQAFCGVTSAKYSSPLSR